MLCRVKKVILSVILCPLLLSPAVAETNVGGIISTDTVWNLNGSPYVLTNDVQIAYGTTLTVDPGVIVNGDDHAIRVWGILDVAGTSDAKVIFNRTHIRPGTATTTTELFAISIQHARLNAGSLYDAKGDASYGSLILRDSILKGIPYLYIWYPQADCYIERNIFFDTGGISIGHDNGIHIYVTNNVFYRLHSPFGDSYSVENWASYGTSETIVENNSFLNTDQIAVELPVGYDSAHMTAVNNYWNTTDPTVIESMIFDRNDDLGSADFIPYLPFLSVPHPDTPSLDRAFTCGDVILDPSETCDDGNLLNGDGCSSTCQLEGAPVCGNGLVERGESCDDGNTVSGDRCSSTCQIELPLPEDLLQCQLIIGKAGKTFLKQTLAAHQACIKRQLNGTLSLATNCRGASTGDATTDAALTAAKDRLKTSLKDACQGVVLEGLGFPKQCADSNGPPFTLGELQQCIRKSHLKKAIEMLDTEFPLP
jgi:cysteine-rich repeat protein